MAVGYEMYQVDHEWVLVKFDESVKVGSLINQNFTLYDLTSATPSATLIPDAFKPIEVTEDWISTSRTLTLWFADHVTLLEGNTYLIRINNLQTPFGTILLHQPIDIQFTVDETDNVDVVDEYDPHYPIDKDVDMADIEDWTVQDPPQIIPPGIDTSTIDYGATPTSTTSIAILSITPGVDSAWYVSPTENDGKISIEFNVMPAANFITSSDFKLQKKKVSGISRWEDVDTVVAAESINRRVNIYLPSTDATPVYSFETAEEHEWWESEYVYRLQINKNVGV